MKSQITMYTIRATILDKICMCFSIFCAKKLPIALDPERRLKFVARFRRRNLLASTVSSSLLSQVSPRIYRELQQAQNKNRSILNRDCMLPI